MLYARWGVGKTVFVGSGGPRTLILRPPTDHTDAILKFYPPGQRPKEWVIHDWDEMDSAQEYLRLHGHEWEWVWLDSISLWQDTGLDDIWEATTAKFPHRLEKHAGKDKGEYGRNMDRLSAWVRTVVGLDSFHFGITAFPFEGEFQGEDKLMPWIQGKMMSEKICGYMNMVGYMEKKKSPSTQREYRVITFRETEDFYAKDQHSTWSDFRLIDPTVPKLTQAVEAAKAGVRPAATGGGSKKKTTTTSGKKKRAA